MNTRMMKKIRAGLLGALMTFCLLTCGDMGYKQMDAHAVGDAAEPAITAQPSGGVFTLGSAITPLTVTASVTDGGLLSYQWYEATAAEWDEGEGTPFAGATTAAFSPVTAGEGISQIYVKVTNTNNNVQGAKTSFVKSDLVKIIVNDPVNAVYPAISQEPENGIYEWIAGLDVETIPVTASSSDGGTLSYQWYSVNSYANEGGTAISGANSESYKPSLTAAGTNYYYVVVTNTKTSVSGRNVSSITSNPVMVAALTPNSVITVNTAEKYQYIRGFGGMAVPWGNFPQDSMADYEKMFNPDTGLGYNMLRIMIPCSDTDVEVGLQQYVLGDTTGDKDRSHYYEMVKLVNRYGGYVLASPWSPPAEWKTNGSISGGGSGASAKLLKTHYNDYADYLKKYCKVMYDKGAPVYAVSIQNEPNFSANYDGCEWLDPDMRDFLKQVGRFTNGVKGFGGGKEISRVLIMNGESANTPAINNSALDDPESRAVIDVLARHNYGNNTENIYVKAKGYGLEVWMTEHNVNGGNEASYPNDSTYNYIWKFMNDVDWTIRGNNENAFVWWSLKRFYSMIGDGQYGTVDGAILPRGYGLAHYAKFATGNTRIAVSVTGTAADGTALTAGSNFNYSTFSNYDNTSARASAFVSEDGNTISLVLFTPRTSGNGGGLDLGTVKIKLPDGFVVAGASAVRTMRNSFFKSESVSVFKDKNAAFISLPVGQIVSVKFTK